MPYVRLRAAGILAVVLSVSCSVFAATEIGPNRLGVPGLASTIVTPEGPGAPLRFGLFVETSTIDPAFGLGTGSLGPKVTSRGYGAFLAMRASPSVALAASIPFRTVDVSGGGESLSAFGDIEAAASLRIFHGERFTLGGFGAVRIPTGEVGEGLSTDEVDGEFGAIATVRFFADGGPAPELRWTTNVGVRVNKAESQGYGVLSDSLSIRDTGVFPPSYPAAVGGDNGSNDMILLRTAVEFRQRWGHIFLEAAVDWLSKYDDANFGESAAWLTPGVYVGNDEGLGFKASWSIGLGSDDPDTPYVPTLPDWYFSANLSYPIFLGGRDRDGDMVPDDEDDCPLVPEDEDGFEDEDGCPDDDNDGDGIIDRLDLAPNLPEDFDGYRDGDGRPDLDNDLDGIVDTEDECPLEPEDFDGFQDEDGCPDIFLDTDGDGLEDSVDSCPEEAEDRDGFEDADGCPENDNDLDGIPDLIDKCPNEREDYDGVEDDDGCPESD